MIRQLPPGPRRPAAPEVESAARRTDVLGRAVRSGGYHPPLDEVVDAVLPWFVTVGPDGGVRPGRVVIPLIHGAAYRGA